MSGAVAHSSSSTARLLNGAPVFAVGWQERILVPSPPAGQGFSYRVDGRFYERVLAVMLTYASSAVAASRFPQLTLKDNNGIIVAQVPAGSAIAASSTVVASLVLAAPGYAYAAVGSAFGFLPDFMIPADWTWSLVTAGADAGDVVTGVVFLVQRYPNDAAAVSVEG